jgi:hypothetical protein
MKIGKIENCARCGENHYDVEARVMAQPFAPPEAGGVAWTHWLPCPTNGDPILVATSDPAGIDVAPLHGLPSEG